MLRITTKSFPLHQDLTIRIWEYSQSRQQSGEICSADTYVSLGGSNGCADQLTNWDGTQIAGLGAFKEKKTRDLSL